MTAFAFDENAHACRCGDVGDEAEVEAFLLEERALLDVHLDELVEAALRNPDGLERSGESGAPAQFFQGATFLIAQCARLCDREHAGHHAAAETSDAKACRLLRCEDYEFDGAARFESELLENTDRFEGAEHA